MIWYIGVEEVVGLDLVAVYLSWAVLCPPFREVFGVSIRPIAPIRPISPIHLLALG